MDATVIMYGKTGCKNCDDAEDKLKRLGVEYEKRDFDKLSNDPPQDTEQRAELREAGIAWSMGGGFLPVFVVGGVGMSYPQAMKKIKRG